MSTSLATEFHDSGIVCSFSENLCAGIIRRKASRWEAWPVGVNPASFTSLEAAEYYVLAFASEAYVNAHASEIYA